MKPTRLLVLVPLALYAAAAQAQDGGAPSGLPAVLSSITQVLSTYVAALAGTSGLTLALLEAFKKLFSVRGRFHRAAVIRWLSEDDASIPPSLKAAVHGPLSALSTLVSLGRAPHYAVREERKASRAMVAAAGAPGATPPPYSPAGAYAEFFHLTTGQKLVDPPQPRGSWLDWRGLDRAVFELEIARMMSQIQDAADTVLNNPARYRNLYAFFTRGCRPEDAAGWRDYVASLANANPANPANPANSPAPTKASSDLYGRIRLLMRRQLDAFQGVTSNRWDEMNQLWAVLVGAAILLSAQFVSLQHVLAPKSDLMPWADLCAGASYAWEHGLTFGIVLKAALGGALAPIAKDLLSSLTSLKFTK
jgi:hypothetical protein